MPAVRSAQYTRIGFCESGACQRHAGIGLFDLQLAVAYSSRERDDVADVAHAG
jgi:hypothetical protein